MINLPPRKKEKNQATNPKSEKDAAVPAVGERNYGIDRLNIGEPANDSEDDSESEDESKNANNLGVESERLFAQRREGHMKKKDRSNSTKRECYKLSNCLNPIQHAESKTSNYSPILQGCTNTRSGRAKLKNFRIVLDSGSSSNCDG